MIPTLQTFLDAKPLYYDEIDLERMPREFARIKSHFPSPKVVHVVGTNGKGTTGRFLANALLQNGFRVGHYTSPHIVNFNERIWLNGNNVEDSVLEVAHLKLYKLLAQASRDALSYFEYTTLLAMLVYEECDYVVLEAGLGGEFDATNVFEKVLSLFVPIDIDHQAFLGESVEEIAATKFRSMESRAILGYQHHDQVKEIYKRVADSKGCRTFDVDSILGSGVIREVRQLATAKGLASYLQDNLLLALSALELLGYDTEVEGLIEVPLFGRLSQVRENVLLDVGHNALAAEAIAKALSGQKIILIYNSYRDKDYEKIMRLLKPIILHVELIDVEDVRVEQEHLLRDVITAEGIEVRKFATIEEDKSYLVFGSFSVAEAFLAYLSSEKGL